MITTKMAKRDTRKRSGRKIRQNRPGWRKVNSDWVKVEKSQEDK